MSKINLMKRSTTYIAMSSNSIIWMYAMKFLISRHRMRELALQ